MYKIILLDEVILNKYFTGKKDEVIKEYGKLEFWNTSDVISMDNAFIDKNLDNKVKLFKSPENIKILVTGGSPGGYSMVCFGSGISITKEIK